MQNLKIPSSHVMMVKKYWIIFIHLINDHVERDQINDTI